MSDLLVTNARLLAGEQWLFPGWLAVDGGRITSLQSGQPAASDIAAAARLLDAGGMAALPGLTNAHTHLSQTFMRGLAGGRPLLRWLKELIWPLQAAMSTEEMRLAAMLGLAENLHCGATRVVDHHKVTRTPRHTRAVLDAARASGMRFTLARAWADRGTNAEDPAALLDELEELFTSLPAGENTLVHAASGPLVPWRCSAGTLQQTHALAQRHHTVTHIHVAETREEVQMTLDESGLRPVAWLDSLGVLDETCQVVHAVWLEEAEMDLLAARHAPVVHCPVANAVLGSGTAPIPALLRRGVQVLLGSDGPASNDTQDIFECIKAALLLGRAAALDPQSLEPAQALAMALAGSRLAVGQPADIILVNLEHTRAAPLHDPTSALALCTHGSDVDTAIVDGKILLQGGKLTLLDEDALLRECQQAVDSLRRRAGLN